MMCSLREHDVLRNDEPLRGNVPHGTHHLPQADIMARRAASCFTQ